MAKIFGFHHTAIHSADFDRTIQFYEKALALKPRLTWGDKGSRAAMIDAGDGNYIEVFERPAPALPHEAAILHFALRTDDCAEMTEQARAAGAEITMEPREVQIDSNAGPVHVKISFFKGPDGEVVELFENEIL